MHVLEFRYGFYVSRLEVYRVNEVVIRKNSRLE